MTKRVSPESCSFIKMGGSSPSLLVTRWSRIFALMQNLISHRVWSIAARVSMPPEQYAGLLAPSLISQQKAVNLLKRLRSLSHKCEIATRFGFDFAMHIGSVLMHSDRLRRKEAR